MTSTRISEPAIQRDSEGIRSLTVAFGPHYFVELERKHGRVRLCVGATHHGIRADASEVDGELEQFIGELMKEHPDHSF